MKCNLSYWNENKLQNKAFQLIGWSGEKHCEIDFIELILISESEQSKYHVWQILINDEEDHFKEFYYDAYDE